MSLKIEIPSLNGQIEAGIAVGVDSSLPDAEKLPILVAGPAVSPAAKVNAVTWAFRRFTNATARKFFVNGVAALMDSGFICDRNGVPDGDWVKRAAAEPIDGLDGAEISQLVDIASMQRALSVVVATKANFWVCNHHTGQGDVQGYVKKILDLHFPNQVTEDVVTAAHSLGHYASTRRVLALGGIAHVLAVTPFVFAPGVEVVFTADVKLRFSSAPAGTHRHEVAFQCAKRLVRSAYGMYCPKVEEFGLLVEKRGVYMGAPASHHLGASYLTGAARAQFADTDAEAFLGRLGTFVNTLYGKSTLAKSPHLSPDKVESYEDYDPQWKQTIAQIQRASIEQRDMAFREALTAGAFVSQETYAQLAQVFATRG